MKRTFCYIVLTSFLFITFPEIVFPNSVENLQAQTDTKKAKEKRKSESDAAYKKGLEKVKAKDYEGALEEFQKAYKLYPTKKLKGIISKVQTIVDKKLKQKKPASSKERKSESDAAYKKGLEKVKAKDYEGALEEFQKAYKLYPTKKLKGIISKVQTIVDKTPKQKPQEKKIISKPQIPEQLSVPMRSVSELSDEISLVQKDLDVVMDRLGEVISRLEPLKKDKSKKYKPYRIKVTEERIQKQPEDLASLRELALEYERKGAISRARDIYLRMISEDPSKADYHYYLGSLYSRSGQRNKANLYYNEALEFDPNHPATISDLSMFTHIDSMKVAINRIRRNLDAGTYEEVLTLCDEGKQRYPNNYIFSYLEGKAYEIMGNIKKAKKLYIESINLTRREVDPLVALGDLYFDQGNYLYASVTYAKVLSLKPYDIDIGYKHGLSYFYAFEWSKATSAWEDLLHYAPNHLQVKHLLPQAYYIMSIDYNRIGYADLSRKYLTSALSVNPRSWEWLAEALKNAGKFYRTQGLYFEALDAYQEAVEIVPENSENYNGLGITYWEMGEKDMAITAWERSLALQPDNNSAKGWLIIARRQSE